MNTIQCEAGDGTVRRGEAVIRSNGRRQMGWHKDCWTLHRATKDTDVAAVTASTSAGSLTERLQQAGVR